jgi:hypothetical protein
MTVTSFENETAEQFADRLLGGWRSIIRTSALSRYSHNCCEDVVREALERKKEPEVAEFLRRLRHLVGPNVNGARLLTEFDDYLLTITGRNFNVWRIDHDDESSPDDFAFWQVSMSRGDAIETGDEAGDVGVGAEISPLAELAAAWLLFSRARGITSASTGEILAAVTASADVPFTEKLGDDFLTAASRVMTPAQLENPAAAPSALSLFLGKHEGEPVEVIDTDRAFVSIAFRRDETAPKSVRRWIVAPVEAVTTPEIVPETASEPEPAQEPVEEDHPETTGPLLIHLLAQARQFEIEPLKTDNENDYPEIS